MLSIMTKAILQPLLVFSAAYGHPSSAGGSTQGRHRENLVAAGLVDGDPA